MTTKTYEELMSEINSMNIEEALKNAEKCLEPFEARDIIKQQQEAINRQKAEIERLTGARNTDPMDFCGVLCRYAEELINKAKAEAVKEFEERAIKNICEKVYAPTPVQSCIVEKCNQVIVETAEEMVGEG